MRREAKTAQLREAHGWRVMARARTSLSAASATQHNASAETAQQKHTQTSETLPVGLTVLASGSEANRWNCGRCSMLCAYLSLAVLSRRLWFCTVFIQTDGLFPPAERTVLKPANN